jgi:signal peptidase
VIDACYRVHPWLPIFVVDAVIGVPFYLFGMSLVGSGRLRSRSRSRDGVSTLRRLLRRYG